PEVDPILGPEMRSTGEVLGLSTYYGEAFFKAQEATQTKLPLKGTVLISVNRKDKPEVVEIARLFTEAGFKILATGNTHKIITEAGLSAELVKKIYEGRPNVSDLITNGDIDLIINSPIGKDSVHDDSYLRKAAIKAKIPYMTTIAAARATVKGILYVQKNGNGDVKSLQEIHSLIKDKN
ncbi:MAG: carbamoyl phosphate synthase large subunit, partial [Coprococcus sp.]